MSTNLAVIIASIGRAELLRLTVAHLAHQTRKPDRVVVVSVVPEDTAGLEAPDDIPLDVIFAEKGLPKQRNAGLRLIGGGADIIAFLDDDFVPARNYCQEAEALFESRPNLVGLTGHVIADGVKTAGFRFQDALYLLQQDWTPPIPAEQRMPALYGCNLCVRTSAIQNLWFDEALPLYGWQEDVDFSFRLGKHGDLLRTERLIGVHLGAKGGRTSGKRLGYSQIANPIYLLGKKSIPPSLAWRLMYRNVLANCIRSLLPEAHVDRRGRLYGNLIAMRHFLCGKLHPEHILSL